MSICTMCLSEKITKQYHNNTLYYCPNCEKESIAMIDKANAYENNFINYEKYGNTFPKEIKMKTETDEERKQFDIKTALYRFEKGTYPNISYVSNMCKLLEEKILSGEENLISTTQNYSCLSILKYIDLNSDAFRFHLYSDTKTYYFYIEPSCIVFKNLKIVCDKKTNEICVSFADELKYVAMPEKTLMEIKTLLRS